MEKPVRFAAYLVFAFLLCWPAMVRSQMAKQNAVDSLHVTRLNADSLWHADSIYIAKLLHSKTVASMRLLDMNNDGKPETLRIEGKIVPITDDILMHFTIKSEKKVLWNESWKASGYFDPADSLPEHTKLARLRHLASTFFSNENFSVLDSGQIVKLLEENSPLDVKPGSDELGELEHSSPVMFSVFRSRTFFYGLVWLPSQKRFVRLWRN